MNGSRSLSQGNRTGCRVAAGAADLLNPNGDAAHSNPNACSAGPAVHPHLPLDGRVTLLPQIRFAYSRTTRRLPCALHGPAALSISLRRQVAKHATEDFAKSFGLSAPHGVGLRHAPNVTETACKSTGRKPPKRFRSALCLA